MQIDFLDGEPVGNPAISGVALPGLLIVAGSADPFARLDIRDVAEWGVCTGYDVTIISTGRRPQSFGSLARIVGAAPHAADPTMVYAVGCPAIADAAIRWPNATVIGMAAC